MLRILYHGAVHLPDDVRRTIERLERNLPSFESLVETVLESSEGDFSEAQQSLIIRFLESKGYLVNTAEMRPRVLACAGIVGTELGYLTPNQIPRLAPGILVSDEHVDAIVAELKSLLQASNRNRLKKQNQRCNSQNLWPMLQTELVECVDKSTESMPYFRAFDCKMVNDGFAHRSSESLLLQTEYL